MYWTRQRIKFYIYYLGNWDRLLDFERASSIFVLTPKKAKRINAYFVSQCLRNALFNEALKLLTDEEWYILIELYRKMAYESYLGTIWLEQGARNKVAKLFGKNYETLRVIEDNAFRKLLEYLNWKDKKEDKK